MDMDHTYSRPSGEQVNPSPRKRRREQDRKRFRRIAKTKVNIGVAFDRWKELMSEKGFQRDAEVASFLLDSYDSRLAPSSTPMKPMREKPRVQRLTPAPPLSSVGTDSEDEALRAILQGWEPESLRQSLQDMSTENEGLDENIFNDPMNSVIDWSDEGLARHGGEHDESSDDEYYPPIALRMGGALKTPQTIDGFPIVGIGETVHDLPAEEDQEEPLQPSLEMQDLPEFQRVTTKEDVIGVKAAIVYENCLMQLATSLILPVKRCTSDLRTGIPCNSAAPFHVNITCKATAMIVEWVCRNGHRVWRWSSQPVLKFGMQAGDFLLATNILLSGSNYTKVALMFNFMNMGMVNPNTFFTIQDTYCVDTIQDFWEEKRSEAISRLQGKDIVVCGDGRNDSPGHSAQYCSYTTMELDSREVIYVATVDKRETLWNSSVMEKEAFIRTVDTLSKEINLVEFCTDAHVQIAALLNPDKGKYKDLGIHHSLDMWHGAKNLAKKIAAASKVKGQSILLNWLKDITNHFWWCCKTADTYAEFLNLWIGITHHVCNVHSWQMGSCQHGPLEDEPDRQWIERDSVSHKALVDIVLNKRFRKSVHKYLRFRSTSQLESFQNHILMYASKRHSFTPPVYEARVLLAALDYNFHRDRPTLTTSEGQQIFRRTYNKNARRYSLYAAKAQKTYDYIPSLQGRVVERRLSSGVGMPRTRTLRPDDPRRLGVVPPVPPPAMSELVRTQVSRGLGSAFQAAADDEQ